MDSNPPFPRSSALRKGRVSIPGQRYLLTSPCNDRKRWFETWPSASAASRAIADPRLWRDSRVLCWVLMPDHLHVLVELGSEETLSQLMQRAKAVIARHVNEATSGQASRIWMPGFHDRALRAEEDTRSVARYMIGNPLRAGLVASIGDYPFWDAVWLDGPSSIL